MAELVTVVAVVLVFGFAAALVATLIAASIGMWLDLLDQLAARRRRRKLHREPSISELLMPDRTFGIRLDEGRIQRGNRSGEPSTPKPDIIPKPQPPSGYRPNPSRPGANPPPRNP